MTIDEVRKLDTHRAILFTTLPKVKRRTREIWDAATIRKALDECTDARLYRKKTRRWQSVARRFLTRSGIDVDKKDEIFCSLQVIFLCLPYCSLCWSGGSGVLAEFQSMVVSGSFGCWPDMAQDISIRSDLWHCYWRSCSLYGRWADFLYRQRAKTRLF